MSSSGFELYNRTSRESFSYFVHATGAMESSKECNQLNEFDISRESFEKPYYAMSLGKINDTTWKCGLFYPVPVLGDTVKNFEINRMMPIKICKKPDTLKK